VTELPPDSVTTLTNGADSAATAADGPPAAAPAAPLPAATPLGAAAEPPLFARLEAVQLRKYWPDEARDFTPWLANEENLTLLGEAIGMNLELVAVEQSVGPFRADIIAKDEDDEVIIENQLDATDHRHLGQIMVYAANRGSGVIVWVARQVTDEYRKVIDWLNEKNDVSFFALEVELWRIASSPVAPKFNVVCEPNEFARAIRSTGGELSATAQLQLEFWTDLAQVMSENDAPFNTPRIAARHWCDLRIGTSRAHIGLTALRNGRLSCELYIGHSQSALIYKALTDDRAEIEALLGLEGKLDWQPLPEKKSCRIALYKDTGSLDHRENWPESFIWMLSWAEKFKNVFAQRVKDIVLPEPTQAAEADAVAGATEPAVAPAYPPPE
jgi:hypothetical protein